MTFVVLAAMAVLVYFLLRAPRRRALAQRRMVSTLLPGDEIVTVGGMLGTVVEIREEWVTLELSPGTTARVRPGAIGARAVVSRTPGGAPAAFEGTDDVTPEPDAIDDGGSPVRSAQSQETGDTADGAFVSAPLVDLRDRAVEGDGTAYGAGSQERDGRPGSIAATASREVSPDAVPDRAASSTPDSPSGSTKTPR